MKRALMSMGLFFGVLACGGGDSKEAPKAAATPAQKIPPQSAVENRRPAGTMLATQHGMGPVKKSVEPTVENFQALIKEPFAVRATPEDAGTGSSLQVVKGENLQFEVYPSDDGLLMEEVKIVGTDIYFPYKTNVGAKASSHKLWDQMTCVEGEGRYAEHVTCTAKAGKKFTYVLKPETITTDLAVLGEEPFVALVWYPQVPLANAAVQPPMGKKTP